MVLTSAHSSASSTAPPTRTLKIVSCLSPSSRLSLFFVNTNTTSAIARATLDDLRAYSHPNSPQYKSISRDQCTTYHFSSMLPVTCNAFGDIIAVIQLVQDIVLALDDARGASEEYTHFVHVLTALGAVMNEVYDLAKASQNASLRQAILDEVQCCCDGINSAHNSISGFERLAEASARSSRGVRAKGLVTKLHWHFLRASEAAKYAKRFGDSHQRFNNFIGLLSWYVYG